MIVVCWILNFEFNLWSSKWSSYFATLEILKVASNSGDDDLSICVEKDYENWENTRTFLEELTAADGEAKDTSKDLDEDDEFDNGIWIRISANF